MKAEDIMKKPLVISENEDINEAAKIMSDRGVGSLVVESKGKLKFFIDEMDVLKNFQKNKKISEVLKTPSLIVAPDADLEEVLEKMKGKKTRRVFVVDKGEIVGVISLIDLINYLDDVEIDDSFFFD